MSPAVEGFTYSDKRDYLVFYFYRLAGGSFVVMVRHAGRSYALLGKLKFVASQV